MRIHKTVRRRDKLDFPQHLNFSEDAEESIEFFGKIKDAFFVERSRNVVINHSTCESISPEAALVLIAELTRDHEYSQRCLLQGNPPKNPRVAMLLGAVGYLGYFRIPWKVDESETRQFLRHYSERRAKPQVAKEIVQHFAAAAQLAPADVKALGKAIIECMDNVGIHAYPRSEAGRYLMQQWWMLGFRDIPKGEMAFCFYDQGVGIPRTIRTR